MVTRPLLTPTCVLLLLLLPLLGSGVTAASPDALDDKHGDTEDLGSAEDFANSDGVARLQWKVDADERCPPGNFVVHATSPTNYCFWDDPDVTPTGTQGSGEPSIGGYIVFEYQTGHDAGSIDFTFGNDGVGATSTYEDTTGGLEVFYTEDWNDGNPTWEKAGSIADTDTDYEKGEEEPVSFTLTADVQGVIFARGGGSNSADRADPYLTDIVIKGGAYGDLWPGRVNESNAALNVQNLFRGFNSGDEHIRNPGFAMYPRGTKHCPDDFSDLASTDWCKHDDEAGDSNAEIGSYMIVELGSVSGTVLQSCITHMVGNSGRYSAAGYENDASGSEVFYTTTYIPEGQAGSTEWVRLGGVAGGTVPLGGWQMSRLCANVDAEAYLIARDNAHDNLGDAAIAGVYPEKEVTSVSNWEADSATLDNHGFRFTEVMLQNDDDQSPMVLRWVTDMNSPSSNCPPAFLADEGYTPDPGQPDPQPANHCWHSAVKTGEKISGWALFTFDTAITGATTIDYKICNCMDGVALSDDVFGGVDFFVTSNLNGASTTWVDAGEVHGLSKYEVDVDSVTFSSQTVDAILVTRASGGDNRVDPRIFNVDVS